MLEDTILNIIYLLDSVSTIIKEVNWYSTTHNIHLKITSF